MLDEAELGDRGMLDAVVEVTHDDSFCGGLGAEQLIWLDTSYPAADWRVGDLVLVESVARPLLQQVARVEGPVAHDDSTLTPSSSAQEVLGVRISRLLALTVNARSGTAVRVSSAPVHRATTSPVKSALSVHFMVAVELQEHVSAPAKPRELAATAHVSRQGSVRNALFDPPGMSEFLAMLLKGSVVIPGQAVAVDWLNMPQLVVAVSISTDEQTENVEDVACDQATAAIIDDLTVVSFDHADSLVRCGMSLSRIEAWVQLPQPVPPVLGEWKSRVLKQVGGLQDQVDRLLGRLHAVFAQAEPDAVVGHSRANQSRQGHCVFVHGDPGCGKTHLVEAALRCAPGVTTYRLDGGQVLQSTLEESVARVATTFRSARRQQPSVVIIEELDALGGMDSGATSLGIKSPSGPVGLAQARVIARLNHEMDRLANGPACAVAVIGTSNRPDNVATSLRRAGRFEVEIEIPALLPQQRKDILRLLTLQCRIETKPARIDYGMRGQDEKVGAGAGKQQLDQHNDLITRLADLSVGYVAADLASLIREAALHAMTEASTGTGLHERARNADTTLTLSWEHLETALVATRPSSLQRLQRIGTAGTGCASDSMGEGEFQSLESLAETVSSEAVRQLRTAILLPLSSKGRAAFRATGLRPSRGALLYGPAGNGKTLLAAAVGRSCTAASNAAAGTDSNFNWIEVHAAELISAVSGESEKNVSALFARARSAAPSILFIDELEILAPSRGLSGGHSSSLNTLERVLSVFLTQLDGLVDTSATEACAAAPVVIIGATRDISAVDPAILRSGRIDSHVHIGPPDAQARAAIIRLRCNKMAATMDGLDVSQIDSLVDATAGCSRAEIDSMCRESVMQALREDIQATQVREEHFQNALAGLPKRQNESGRASA